MHTATLLHDDVVDESELRRGKLSARMLWGNEASVLVGDFLLGQAFQHDGRGRLAARARHSLLRRRHHRRRRSDAACGRQEHRDHRGRISRRHPRQDRRAVRRRLRGRARDRQPAEGRADRVPLGRHESRHRVPARRRRAGLWRQGRQARQEHRRRFPRGQDHAAGGAGVPPRQRQRARVLGQRAGARRDRRQRPRSRHRPDDQAPRAGRHDQPRPALRRDGRRRAGAVPGLADEDRARAGRGVLSGAGRIDSVPSYPAKAGISTPQLLSEH